MRLFTHIFGQPNLMNTITGKNVRYVETLETIGKDLHVTRERVRQIEESGLSKLRNPKVSKIFEGHHKNAGQEISGTSNKKAKKKVKK